MSKFLFISALSMLVFVATGLAQDASSPQASQSKPRVFVTDSKSWEVSGGFGGSSEGFGGGVRGGARPQTVEIIKTFEERCPAVTVTIRQEKADFVILLDHEGAKGYARKDNKVAVFDKDGDSIFSRSTRSLGNAVKDACQAIMNAPAPQTPPPSAGTPVSAAAPATQSAPAPQAGDLATAALKSTPDGAEITVDGKFVGSTPSTVRLTPGDHRIAIEKAGYRTWQRTMTVNPGGIVTVDAALEKNP